MCGFAREKKTTAKLSKFIHPLLRSYATLNVAQIDAEIEFIEQTECLVVAVVVIALTATTDRYSVEMLVKFILGTIYGRSLCG